MEARELAALINNIEVYNPERSASIGLYNINQRLRLCYGDRYGIGITSKLGEGTCVRMWLPL
jgi:two-component system sensor histidine kinase YesM